MEREVWYKTSDFEEVVPVKESRMKQLLNDLILQGKIEACGNTKGKVYKKVLRN